MINFCKTQLFQLKLHRMKWIRPTPRDQGFLKKTPEYAALNMYFSRFVNRKNPLN